MEETILPLSTILTTPSDTFMDLDYIDELLLEGCWLEANGSEFSRFDSSTPISPFDTSFFWPTLEPNTTDIEPVSTPSKNTQEERQKPPLTQSQSQSHLENITKPENHSLEPSKRWWIDPRASTPVMDRLIQALSYMKNSSRDKDILIQVWVPVNRGGKRVLTTNHQPFSLDLNCCPSLAHYRDISVNYHFSAEDDSKEVVGLPGRVFRSRVPEWTPDVRFFTRDEYPRVGHAQQYDVRGTLAVPVLEQGSRSCLGVIEVVLTTQKIKYRPELESVCKALEAVDLTSSEVSTTPNVKTRDLSYQAALPEISQVLKSACETHKLPLAQTWVPCTVQGKGGCRHSDDNFANCVSPVEPACHVGDPRVQGFLEACSEYHLLKGQGIVGRAFRTNQPCFSRDVTACSKTEYPLSHHARMFGLKSGVAIRLRSIYTGKVDFVLEFFLPMDCEDPEEQRQMLTSLSSIIQNVCRTLRVVTEEELQEECCLKDEILKIDPMRLSSHNEGGKSREMLVEASGDKLGQGDNSSLRDDVTFIAKPCTSGDGSSIYKTGEKRRVKAEKTITLQVLRQHFAGSLKDAAKNLGVCPTTLKRICRQHGIQRWPSRKIKKVGHSLQKIQRVIDSVQGTSGALQIDSFYSNFPEFASPNASRATQFSNSKPMDNLSPLDQQPDNNVSTLSPSPSCSQNSSSSQCYSSGTHPNSYTFNFPRHDDQVVKEEQEPFVNGTMKRARSDANLHFSNDGPKIIPRSHSHVSFHENREGKKLPEKDAPRIKVTYGEDAIRFRMQNNWGYNDLLREISRRFGVDDANGFHLKYLDDDEEWVLLTCDADLEECIDVSRSSRSHTIKLAFLRDSQTQFGRSFGVIRHSL